MNYLSPRVIRADSYLKTNAAINAVLFNGRYRQAPIYLSIENEVEEEIAHKLGVLKSGCPTSIARATVETLDWTSEDVFSWHYARHLMWIRRGRAEAPPFTALLVTLSHAAAKMREDDVHSATNFYDRLFEVLEIKESKRQSEIRRSMHSTVQFWHSLNEWLAENDGEFGKATADKINSWPFVSYALSQVLVRHADRQRLWRFFSESGFGAHEKIRQLEMSLYLSDWMRGSGPSTWLKQHWDNPATKERITAAACAELEAWGGAAAIAADGSQQLRLNLIAFLKSFPRPEIKLLLGTSNDNIGNALSLRLSEAASPLASAAFGHCSRNLRLSKPEGCDLTVLEPVKKFALSPLLAATFELISEQTRFRLQRSARPVMPLAKDELEACYREVGRVALLRQHMILCHQAWCSRVSDLLEQTARPGYKKWRSTNLNGLPDDWILFSGVEILSVDDSTGDDLTCLVPLSDHDVTEVTGGLRLSQNEWHADAAPEVTAAAPNGPIEIKLISLAGAIVASAESSESQVSLPLRLIGPFGNTEYTLTVSVAGKTSSTTKLCFTTASVPRRVRDSLRRLAYRIGNSAAATLLAADGIPYGPDELAIQGMIPVGSPVVRPTDQGTPVQFNELALPPPLARLPGETSYRLKSAENLPQGCVTGGYHHWDCEAFLQGQRRDAPKWKACRRCHDRILTRNRGVSSAQPEIKGRRSPSAPTAFSFPRPVSASPRMEARDSAVVSVDIIFDGLCYVGGGTWRNLKELTSAAGDEEFDSHNLIAALVSLGHIDAGYDERGIKPSYWAVAPPALVFTPGGEAFLAGFRNKELIAIVSERLKAAGGVTRVEQQRSAPSAYLWSGLVPKEAAKSLAGVTDPHGRYVAVSVGFSGLVANAARQLSHLAAEMPLLRIGSQKDLRKFDPHTVSWRLVNQASVPGAYSADFFGRRYFYVDDEGSAREGSAELVKILAARREGVMLHGYSRDRSELQFINGCQPPGLLSRALVACSGLLPRREGRRQVYSGVTADLATSIITKLYS